MDNHIYLEFTIKILNLVDLWHKEKTSFVMKIRKYWVVMVCLGSMFPITTDAVNQFLDGAIIFSDLNEDFVALSALIGVIYMSMCFIHNNDGIEALVKDLKIFEAYTPASLIEETEKNTMFNTRLFIGYGIVGNLCYSIMPFFTYKECKANRTERMIKYGIPCGLVVNMMLPGMKSDAFPMEQFFIVEGFLVSTMGTTVVLSITMLVCGILNHVNTHLRHLNQLITQLSTVDEDNLNVKVRNCIEFHTAIIDYANRVNKCFSKIMLLHISWTGFIISVLGFEIIMVSHFEETVRFVMHLGGWIGMLFLVCYYGQTLMDESSGISEAVYSMNWYGKPAIVQRYLALMLLRSQHPLTLKAAGLRIMSLATFQGVLNSAYSYMTLLLRMKS